MALYSEKVMDHFKHPRNVGIIENADGIGEVGNAKCGDIMKIYLKIDDDIITDVKFETFGCGSAIASSSMAVKRSVNADQQGGDRGFGWTSRTQTALFCFGGRGNQSGN